MMLSTLAIALLHSVFVSLAGFLLWRLWGGVARMGDRRTVLVIAAGFVLRSVTAQVLFWISYLRMPVASALQDGDGFWKLAIDARQYFDISDRLMHEGWRSVLLIDKGLPSPVFVQTLTVFVVLFGAVASVGALLNLFAYLGACAAILHLGRSRDGIAAPAVFALAAISFAPSIVLWSVQPLKDVLFIFAVAAFVAACSSWQEGWLGRGTRLRFAISLLVIVATLYAVVGIRWYCGLLLWGASLPFFLLTTIRSRRRVIATVANAAVFVLLSQTLMFGAGPYFPPAIAALLGHPHRGSTIMTAPSDVASVVARSRHAFESAPANTQIRMGNVLAAADYLATRDAPPKDPHPTPARSHKRHVEAAARRSGDASRDRAGRDSAANDSSSDETALPAPMASAEGETRPSHVAIANAAPPAKGTNPSPAAAVSSTPTPAPTPTPIPTRTPTPPAPARQSSPAAAARGSLDRSPAPATSTAATAQARRNESGTAARNATAAAPATSRETAVSPKPSATPATSLDSAAAPPVRKASPSPPAHRPAPVRSIAAAALPKPAQGHPQDSLRQPSHPPEGSIAAAPQAPVAAATKSTPPHGPPAVVPVRPTVTEDLERNPPPLLLPESTAGRLLAGAAAVVLPRFVGERTGLIHVEGGRGLWPIIELDTLGFDVLLFVVLFYVLRGIRTAGALRNPSFWLVLLTTGGIAGLLSYTISNFGTLFRHRAMISVGLCLLLVVAREAVRPRVPSEVPECP